MNKEPPETYSMSSVAILLVRSFVLVRDMPITTGDLVGDRLTVGRKKAELKRKAAKANLTLEAYCSKNGLVVPGALSCGHYVGCEQLCLESHFPLPHCSCLPCRG